MFKDGHYIDSGLSLEEIEKQIEANKSASIQITKVLEDRIKKGGDIEASAVFI